MDGTVPFYYEPIQGVEWASWCRYSRNTTACSSSPSRHRPDGFHDRHHQRPVFTAWAIKANGFTSVVLDNKDAANGVSATVDLGAAVKWREPRSICRDACRLTETSGRERDLCWRPGHGGGRVESQPTLHSDDIGEYRFSVRSPASAAVVRVFQ